MAGLQPERAVPEAGLEHEHGTETEGAGGRILD